MIINIPINVDEHIFEEKIQREYDAVLTKKLEEIIEKTLVEMAGYSWRKDAKDGMAVLIKSKVDEYMKDYKDDIINRAADILAKRVERTKKAKEVLNEGKTGITK